ncbi:MAG: Hsp20/alpha crystallin family protein [Geminicoccaceae bacterium]
MDFKSLTPFGRPGRVARPGADDVFTSLHREMERVFDEFGRHWPMMTPTAGAGFMTPKVDVAETAKGLEVTAELPGIDEKDIELEFADGVLTLKAERKEESEQKDEKKQFHVVERSYGTFMRRFAVPFVADEDKVEAHFAKGVLSVHVPRAPEAEKPMRKIAIKSA